MRDFRLSTVLKTMGFALVGMTLTASTARATSLIDDPLHGFCGTSAGASTCIDNGTITPTSSLGQFGFYASPDNLTGTDWLIAILVPTNIANSDSFSFTVDETAGSGNTAKNDVASSLVATVFDSTDGDLATYLGANTGYGITPSNTNPQNSWGSLTNLGTSAVFPTITGFRVYLIDLDAATLFKSSLVGSECATPDAGRGPARGWDGDSVLPARDVLDHRERLHAECCNGAQRRVAF
jgi:hypothetical protein